MCRFVDICSFFLSTESTGGRLGFFFGKKRCPGSQTLLGGAPVNPAHGEVPHVRAPTGVGVEQTEHNLSDGLHLRSEGLQPKSDGLQSEMLCVVFSEQNPNLNTIPTWSTGHLT